MYSKAVMSKVNYCARTLFVFLNIFIVEYALTKYHLIVYIKVSVT